MNKFPLTAEGIDGLQAELLALEDALLQEKAERLADDLIPWLCEHFELTVEQLEFMREMDNAVLLALGWSLASSLVCRLPMRISGLEHFCTAKLANASGSLDIGATIFLKAEHKASGALSLTINKIAER